jgi:hypothetical protein
MSFKDISWLAARFRNGDFLQQVSVQAAILSLVCPHGSEDKRCLSSDLFHYVTISTFTVWMICHKSLGVVSIGYIINALPLEPWVDSICAQPRLFAPLSFIPSNKFFAIKHMKEKKTIHQPSTSSREKLLSLCKKRPMNASKPWKQSAPSTNGRQRKKWSPQCLCPFKRKRSLEEGPNSREGWRCSHRCRTSDHQPIHWSHIGQQCRGCRRRCKGELGWCSEVAIRKKNVNHPISHLFHIHFSGLKLTRTRRERNRKRKEEEEVLTSLQSQTWSPSMQQIREQLWAPTVYRPWVASWAWQLLAL